jgi:hypothetical protein
MLYNTEEFPNYVRTAGKITIVTAFAGLMVFVAAFVIDFGTKTLNSVAAQNNYSTTTLKVLNTPPTFIVGAYEVIESSTSSPTNSGDVQQWSALGSDSNGAPYFLLICESSTATATANAAADSGSLGTAPPECAPGTVQYAVSAGTVSDTLATAATTTLEWGTGQFLEQQNWTAWVCDDDELSPQCSIASSSGLAATNSSPFNINNRPVLTDFYNDGPVDPGGTIQFLSTSTDLDTLDVEDSLTLVVCNTNTYNTSTNDCSAGFIASTTFPDILSDAVATYTVAAITRDDTYEAYGFLVDVHGHEAAANPIQFDFDVNNVAPTVLGGDINLNEGSDITLLTLGGQTTGFTLDFTIRDANSCVNALGGDEISTDSNDHLISVFRSNNSTTTCSGVAADYDPNDCYVNGVNTSVWNLSCTATTTCAGPTQDDIDYACDFPLWFLADPSDNGVNTPTAFEQSVWTAGLAASDDDFATGTMATTSISVELNSLAGIDIADANIAFGEVIPGANVNLTATSVAQNVGNTGLDQLVQGESMCDPIFSPGSCANSATSTIPASEQQFSSTSLQLYNSALATALSSTTPAEVELDIIKTTSTTSPAFGTTYWGIAVPASITLAGDYQGLNTFSAVVAEPTDW